MAQKSSTGHNFRPDMATLAILAMPCMIHAIDSHRAQVGGTSLGSDPVVTSAVNPAVTDPSQRTCP